MEVLHQPITIYSSASVKKGHVTTGVRCRWDELAAAAPLGTRLVRVLWSDSKGLSGRKGRAGGALRCYRLAAHQSVYFCNITSHNNCYINNHDLNMSSLQHCVTPVRICLNASSTPVESRAEVSMKARLLLSAKVMASSVGTVRRWRRSLCRPQGHIEAIKCIGN